ncbi:hypothetical protein Spirs_0730 [Sediminispirochaeta smaragdinae DSM 11293]|uniref:Peptidase M15C domain-containing protein n=2 Tax=Sediminispirochaeta TaxID=1911556 RepID=E1RBY5_SEDSS|nr:hypothetical protein Spirs_0730 [Sediminispirochaeta smaragdinae DSM 11293]
MCHYHTVHSTMKSSRFTTTYRAVFLICIIFFFRVIAARAQTGTQVDPRSVFSELRILKRAYPDIVFSISYDTMVEDWKITIEANEKSTSLYWADGRYVRSDQYDEKERYRLLIYPYRIELMDPATLSPEQIAAIESFGSTKRRSRAPVSNTAFFDAIYDSATRSSVESHIVKFTFLGKQINVHEKITGPLKRVETKILQLARNDSAVKEFTESIASMHGYAWREVRDTAGRSFHSMGLALDMLPSHGEGKVIYWLWEKNSGNETWMLVPLDKRWMPPDSVLSAFEEEGFIWGGKWPVWDNMHFEYRPELIISARENERKSE